MSYGRKIEIHPLKFDFSNFAPNILLSQYHGDFVKAQSRLIKHINFFSRARSMSNFPWNMPPSKVECEPVLGIHAWDIAYQTAIELQKLFLGKKLPNLEKEKHFLNFSSLYLLEHLATALEFDQPEIFGEFYAWTSNVLMTRSFPEEFLIQQINIIINLLKSQTPKTILDRIINISETRCSKGSTAVPNSDQDNVPLPSPEILKARENFLDGLLNGNREEAFKVIKLIIDSGYTLEEICIEIFPWAMYRVGELWENNQIMWMEERMATAICQYVLSMIFTQARESKHFSKNSPSIFLVNISPEHHDLGLWIISDLLESKGIEVHIANSDLDLIRMKYDLKNSPKFIVGFSITLMPHLISCHKIIQEFRKMQTGEELTIIVGGQAFTRSGLPAQKMDADLCIKDAKHLLKEIPSFL